MPTRRRIYVLSYSYTLAKVKASLVDEFSRSSTAHMVEQRHGGRTGHVGVVVSGFMGDHTL